MSKQIVPLDVGYSSKKEGKSNAIKKWDYKGLFAME